MGHTLSIAMREEVKLSVQRGEGAQVIYFWGKGEAHVICLNGRWRITRLLVSMNVVENTFFFLSTEERVEKLFVIIHLHVYIVLQK